MSAFGNLSHANLRRTTALGGADRGDIDPDDSEVVELHRRHLSDRHRHFGTGANVMGWLTTLRIAEVTFAERRTCLC